MRVDGSHVTLAAFEAAVSPCDLNIAPEVLIKVDKSAALVAAHAAGDTPVYGLNTGLGANLAHRLSAEEMAAFQRQLIEGRAIAVGDPLREGVGRRVLLARILSAASGAPGVSRAVFDHLCALFRAGLCPAIPQHGSIGASDLVQTSVWALAVLGKGQMWRDGVLVDAKVALADANMQAPELSGKDGMVLASHPGVTLAVSAQALAAARIALDAARWSALLSYAGYRANTAILDADIQALRAAPGQAEAAAWLLEHLQGCAYAPRRVQEALSFRTVASVLGAAETALTAATNLWEIDLNGCGDSPALLPDGRLVSSPHFSSPALSIALEQVSLAMAMVGQGALQRSHKMLQADLSGLPRFLSPGGGSSAGLVPIQKSLAALLAEMRALAMPVAFDPAPIAETVEDMAPMTAQAATKLLRQSEKAVLLFGCEAFVAAQAIDLRGAEVSDSVAELHARIRQVAAMVTEDRALGAEVTAVARVLENLKRDA